jgi:DNA uptake protein ComE-like DNA-binding protein
LRLARCVLLLQAMSTPRTLPLVLLISLLGCAGAEDTDEATGHTMGPVGMSAAQAQLVLDLVNYPGTDATLLDDEVALDRRAAENIIAHRDGADALCPTVDDDGFDDLAELDAIPYVGDAAFTKLVNWAAAHPVPAAEHVEGVDFAGWEAEAIIWGVNHANLQQLDVVVGLDARAAANLVTGAPYGSVSDMGPVGYVGQSALELLRDYASPWWSELTGAATAALGGTFDGVTFDDGTAAIALDIANLASLEQLVTQGMWSQGASAIVESRPYVDLAQIASVSGVGQATMQALHDYASSPEWPPAPPSSEDCSTGLVVRSDADVADFDGLLVAATTGDWPYGAVIALQVNPCIDMGQANMRDGVIDEIIANYVINWVIGPQALQHLSGDDFELGASLFVSRMDSAKQAIEEEVQYGWTPTTPTDTDRLARLDAIHSALTAGPRSQPSAYWLATMKINAAECSEDAAILLDPTTNHIWIMHRMPGC